jgi:hypothetical protein
MSTLSKKLQEFKEKYPSKKNVSLNDLKAVYRRGSGAYSQSHRPFITGGKPNSRAAWSFARVNKFLEKAAGKKVKAAYVQDDDLLKFSNGGKVEKLIEQGVIDLKFYKTTIQHANTYGFESTNPLYFQRIFVNKNDRNNGLGSDVLQYLDEYAKDHNHDLIFGHIEQKSEPSIDVIKNLLQKNGYSTIEGNNDFYKYIDANASLNDDFLKYEEGGNVGVVTKYIKNIEVIGDDEEGILYSGSYGNSGVLSWINYGEIINVITIESGNKKGSSGTMAIASLFLLNPKVQTITYQDNSHFEDGTSFWVRIGGDYTDLERSDFFNYFQNKFGYNPDIRYADGGEIKSFFTWFHQWYKGISDKMNIMISLPNEISAIPYQENVVILDLFEKTDQNVQAKTYLKKIIDKADEYGVTIYYDTDPIGYKDGGQVNNCKEFILQNKSVLTNGFYFNMHDLSKLFDPYGQMPTHLDFTLVSYNSGGQSNLDVINTINPTTLVDKLSELLGLEKNQSYVVVHYVISKAKRLTNINQITTEKIVVVDRDMVVCENLNEYADGGTTITKFKNEQEMEQMIQCVQCDWTWSTADSDEADKYVCHNCGFDNSLFYDTDILKPTLTIQEIAEKHNEDIDYVIDQLVKGTEHEMEHTDNIDVAKKIALHHVAETPDYYEKLEKMGLEDGGELPEEVILEDNSTPVEIEIIEYLKQQMAESTEVLHCNDSRVFKTMICKTKIEIAEKRLSETENPEEQNVWNECILIWSNAMTDIFENNIPVREYKDGGTPCGCGSVYEKGGLAYGNSHDKGGMPLEVSSTGQKIEIEGGEGVVNKRSMQMNKKLDFQGKKYTPCEVVSKINEMGGGVKFKCSDVNEIIAEDGHF